MATTPKDNSFSGDKKVGQSILLPYETRFKKWVVPKIPSPIETWHLTYCTIIWSLLSIIFGFLAIDNLNWIWGISIMILFQYLTDLFDGELGRYRNTGLIKWGFYMDHFLDYIFICSLVFSGYLFAPESVHAWYFLLVVIMGGFMDNSFLLFGATNKFEIYQLGFGPTEGRFGLIIINTFIIFMGTGLFNILLPASCVISLIFLIFHCYQIHKKLWAIDMDVKNEG